MNDFKTSINPIVAVGRLAFSIFFLGLTCFTIYLLLRDFKTNGLKQYLAILLGMIIFGAMFEALNLLTYRTKTISKDDIKGFSTSTVPYRIWNFKQILIYLKDGTKINIMQFAYFNFKKIKLILVRKNYNYLGHEPYIWKWFNSRIYQYDD